MENKYCEICGNDKAWYTPKFNKTLCHKHYYHFKTFGEIKNTKYDPNPINIYDHTIGIKLYNSSYELVGECIIDKEDYDKVKNIRWRLGGDGYAVNNSDKKENLYVHRIINDTPKDLFCDHINRDKLNCKKENLRTVTHRLNCINIGTQSRNTSGVKGVSWSKSQQKWRSRITINSKEISLGQYKNYLDAVKARIKAEALYFGEYSSNYNPNNNCIEVTVVNSITSIAYRIYARLNTPITNLDIKEQTLKEIQCIPSDKFYRQLP